MAQRTRTRTVVPNRFMRRGPIDWTGPLPFGDGNYVNASPRYLVDSVTPQVLGPFAANVPAIATLPDGRRYIQIEEQRQNIMVRNQEYDDPAWTGNLYSVTPGQTDPVGGATADKVIPTASLGTHFIKQNPTYDGASYYTHSVFAKANGYRYIRVWLPSANFVGTPWANFDLQTGTVTLTGGGVIEMIDCGGGWYRCSVTALSDVGGNTKTDISILDNSQNQTFTGDGTSGVDLWMSQVEIGQFPSSPIHTVAAAVTRNIDSLIYPASAVPERFRIGEGKVNTVPFWATNEDTFNFFWELYDAGVPSAGRTYQFYDHSITSIKIQTSNGGTILHVLAPCTVARQAEQENTHRADAGNLTLAGYAAGDGTIAGTPWDQYPTPASLLYYGMNRNSQHQFNGLLSEAYVP